MADFAKNDLLRARSKLTKLLKEQNYEEAKSVLKTLRRINVDRKLLKETECGKFINYLKKSGDSEIVSLCSDIIAKWAKDVENSDRKSSDASGSGGKTTSKFSKRENSKNSDSASSSTYSASTRDTKPETKPIERPKERTLKGDNVEYEILEDEYRERIRSNFYTSLGLGNDIDKEILFELASEIEKQTHEIHSQNRKEYTKRVTSINFNLRDIKNPELNKKLISKELPVDEFVKMTTDQMASDQRKAYILYLKRVSLAGAQAAGKQEAETDMFRCGKCGQRKCTYYQKQIRSADEPMTTFVTCVNCNNRWKFC